MTLSLHTLPIAMVYRIFDNLNNKTILISCLNVCTRLNQVLDSYQRYQVSFHFTIKYIWFPKKLILDQLFILCFPQTLTILDLEGDRIGADGTEHLANALKNNKVSQLALLT